MYAAASALLYAAVLGVIEFSFMFRFLVMVLRIETNVYVLNESQQYSALLFLGFIQFVSIVS